MNITKKNLSRVMGLVLAFVLVLTIVPTTKTLAAGETASTGQEVVLTVYTTGSANGSSAINVLYDTASFEFVDGSLVREATTVGISALAPVPGRIDADLTVTGVVGDFDVKTGTSFNITTSANNAAGTWNPPVKLFSLKVKAIAVVRLSDDTFHVKSGTTRYADLTITYSGDFATPTQDLTVTATASKTEVTPSSVANSGDFSVDVVVNSDAAFSAVKAEVTYDPSKVTFKGSGAGPTVTDSTSPGTLTISNLDLDGKANEPLPLATLNFTASAVTTDTSAAFTVSGVEYGVSGTTTDKAGAAGTSGSIAIKTPAATENPADRISVVSGSNLAPDGYQVIAYKAPDVSSYTGGYKYGSDEMFYAEKYDSSNVRYFIWIVPTSETAAETAAKITAAGTVKIANGNVNGNTKVNIVDAQIAFDLSKGSSGPYYSDTLTTLTIENRLNADVDHDGKVTVADARAIQWHVHYGNFNVTP